MHVNPLPPLNHQSRNTRQLPMQEKTKQNKRHGNNNLSSTTTSTNPYYLSTQIAINLRKTITHCKTLLDNKPKSIHNKFNPSSTLPLECLKDHNFNLLTNLITIPTTYIEPNTCHSKNKPMFLRIPKHPQSIPKCHTASHQNHINNFGVLSCEWWVIVYNNMSG